MAARRRSSQTRPELLTTFWDDPEVRMHFRFPLGEHVAKEHIEQQTQDYPLETNRARYDEALATMGTLADALPEKSLDPTTNKQTMAATTAKPIRFTLAVRPKPADRLSASRFYAVKTLQPLLECLLSFDVTGTGFVCVRAFGLLMNRPGSSTSISKYLSASR
ncbi:hypothetical protein AC579_7792 [Pseudocercospora musae]|uniref:Uncharacterized protein n=1 Tax=Pseudocercospora musae TaxID=113226 RepID=A0A139IJQ0_9PEZI|nr:hypothetical protein AC579_7792 [Pseudocercospora musae]